MSADVQIEDADLLQLRLAEKEEVVRELTARLEQAAEQLDRMHRSGADRGAKVSGIPKQVVEQQAELVAELQEAVMRWQELQTTSMLERIEIQLEELREFLQEQFAPEPEPEPEEATSEEATDDSEQPIEPDVQQQADSSVDDVGEIEKASPAPPLELDDTTVQDLQSHIKQQDAYLDYLSERVKQIADAPVLEWEQPEDLESQLQTVAGQLKEAAELTEVELSHQSSRLKRKQQQLAEREQQILEEIRELGIDIPDTSEGVKAWVAALGIGGR